MTINPVEKEKRYQETRRSAIEFLNQALDYLQGRSDLSPNLHGIQFVKDAINGAAV